MANMTANHITKTLYVLITKKAVAPQSLLHVIPLWTINVSNRIVMTDEVSDRSVSRDPCDAHPLLTAIQNHHLASLADVILGHVTQVLSDVIWDI